jgi:BirA family biotin operon repressor/biotin-[acetyl-CoA-carboxylase] ligase
MLRRLADGAIHSSAALSETTGLSRRQVARLAAESIAAGLPFTVVRGRGYRLAEPVALIDAEAVRAAGGAGFTRLTLATVAATGSTSSDLLAAASEGPIHGAVLVAEVQSAGRGRRGQPWRAALGGSLTFSLGWTLARGAAALGGLSLAVGVAASRALRQLGYAGVQLKWPNDLVWRMHKLAGILVECVPPLDPSAPATVVVGIGVNVQLPAAVREAIPQPVTDLARCGGAVDRNVLLAALLDELVSVLDTFDREGFAAVRDEWTRLHAHQGRPVTLRHADGRVLEGDAVGVADDGALLLARNGRIERAITGDVSLRQAGGREA